MKHFLSMLTSFLLTATMLSATPYDVKKFDSISASGIYDITLEKGPVCSVDIDASPSLQGYLMVSVVGTTLHLSISPKAVKTINEKNNYIKAKIVMPEIQSIDLGGAAKLNASGVFISKDEIEMEISGAAVVSGLDLAASRFDIEVSGAAKMNSCIFDGRLVELEASGASKVVCDINATETLLDISGATNFNTEVKSSKLTVDASGACSANLNVSGLSKAHLEASGSARVSVSGGKAEELTIEASGASTVKAPDLVGEIVVVETSAAAKADVTAAQSLTVDARGASTVTYGLAKNNTVLEINATNAKVRKR